MNASVTVSAAARPLALRKRPDLVVSRQRLGGRTILAVKDPLALRYYHLREEEYFVLQQLDGHRSAEQIQAAFQQEFAPRRLPMNSLLAFLGMLHREHLVTSDAPGQDRTLRDRRQRSRRNSRLAAWSNPLAIRFRGVDPDRFLSWLHMRLRWLFEPWVVVASVLLMFAAVTWIVVQFDQFQSRLPTLQALLSPATLIWLGAAIAIVKMLHELAHGLACKHYGGECHELGLMLLVFTPCLFVNVSDSWMLPDRRQRIAIAGAGIWSELLLASLCTFVWWFTEPGLLNSICLQVMFVSSVGTVLFNANPLLPYDGYYILVDLWQMPNLRQQSSGILRDRLAQWLLGLEPADERIYPERGQLLLMAYAIASLLYRLFIIVAILWFCHVVLRPHGLQVIAQLLTVLVVLGLVAGSVSRAWRFWANPVRRGQVKSRRMLAAMTALVTGLVLLLAVPLPYRIHAPVVIEPLGARRVFVSTPGRLRWAIEPGSVVHQGETLAELANHELARWLDEFRGRRDVLQTELEGVQRRSALQIHRGASDAGSQIPAIEAALTDLNHQIEEIERQMQRLVIRAPQDGTVMPPRSRVGTAPAGQLATWEGGPLEVRNREAFLTAGTELCLVGDPDRVQGVAMVDQSGRRRLRPGQTVYLQLDQCSSGYLEGQISELSESRLETIPPELLATRQLPVQNTRDGQSRVIGTFYHATIELPPAPMQPVPGGVGRARIVVEPVSLGQRIAAYLERTIRQAD